MSSVLKSIAIPGLLVGITTYQLRGHLSSFSDFFFAAPLSDQACLLTLLFAVFFGILSFALALLEDGESWRGGGGGSGSGGKADSTSGSLTLLPVQEYPLAALDKAETDKDRFKVMYPMLRDEMLQHMKVNNEMNQEALDWCKEMMDYNVPGGKLNRGTTVLTVYRALQQGSSNTAGTGTESRELKLTSTETARAAVLGWAIEFLQAFFLVADDVMDESKTRRGQPCWYKVPKVKWIAINDSFLLESYVFNILKQHFGNEPAMYTQLVDLLLNVIQKTEFGQLLDLTSQPNNGKIDLTRFTMERYCLIVKYKTAFYSFYLPVAMGMILSGIRNPQAFETAQRICCIMGEYFQIQDDYLDCYGDPVVIGKIGTDIQDNKCSWLVVQALMKANDKQRKLLEQNYGQWNDGKVAKIKALYKELNLEQTFAQYEESSYAAIQKELENVAHLMPKDVFEVLLKKIYKRSK